MTTPFDHDTGLALCGIVCTLLFILGIWWTGYATGKAKAIKDEIEELKTIRGDRQKDAPFEMPGIESPQLSYYWRCPNCGRHNPASSLGYPVCIYEQPNPNERKSL